jgi:GT2 family glycosyltransferase
MPPSRLPRQGRPRRPPGKVRVSVVVPVFNQAAVTAQCLQALLREEACEIVVVDDASIDATPDLLASHGNKIQVVTHRTNAGFARSCNDGAAAALASDYLLFLNNDTIPEPGWLEALVRYADQHPAVAAVGSKLLYPDNTIQHAGVVICQDRYPRHIYMGFPAAHPAVTRSRRYQIVTAACLLVRRRLFEQAGGFDPAFQNGFEDVDLCLRLGERGQEIHYCAESILYHLESVSPGRFKHDRQNVALYRQRWLDRVRPDDLNYYAEDGLLRLSYEGRFPISIEVSPLLATLDGGRRGAEAERLLREQSRQVAGLQRENTRLCLELGRRAADSPERRYQQLREQIREAVQKLIPAGATVLVISKGDGSLLELPGCRGWHFPQAERGAYAGHHPANSAEAIAHLEWLRARGGGYLLIPATSQWWLDHYEEFRQHLETNYARLGGPGGSCWIYALRDGRENKLQHAPAETTI